MNAHRTWAAGVIGFQAWLLLLAGESLWAAVAAVGLATALFAPPVHLGRAWWWTAGGILGLGIAAAWWLTTRHASEYELAQATWTLPAAAWLVVLQTLQLLRAPRGERLTWPVSAMSIVALLLLFGSPATPIAPARALAWAVVGIGVWGLFQSTAFAQQAGNGRGGWRRWAIASVVLSAAALVAWQLDAAITIQVPRFQAAVMTELARRVNAQGFSRSYHWSATLSSVSAEKKNDPNAVALRVYCAVPPGYLRSAAYDTLFDNEWTVYERAWSRGRFQRLALSSPVRSLPGQAPGVPVPPREGVFIMDERARGPFVRLDILNDPLRGPAYFTPLGAAYLQGGGREVLLTDHGVLTRGLDTREAYTAWAAADAVGSPPGANARRHLLEIPSWLEPDLTPLAEQMPGPQESVEQKVAAVERYFRERYGYSLRGFEVPRGQRPLSHFLRERPAAHCEFFASAAVMLLRQQGIPARYVTGYVVTELESDTGAYWLARNRHAHAWAEAYDDQRQRWVIVEATPGVDAPKDLTAADAQQTAAAAANAAAQATGGQQTFGVAALWMRIRNWDPTSILWQAVGLVLAGGAAWVAWRLFRGAAKARPPQRLLLLRRMDRMVARRKLRRDDGETLHQFARRLRLQAGSELQRAQAARDAWLDLAADWYVSYAQSVYGPAGTAPPPPPLPGHATKKQQSLGEPRLEASTPNRI